MRNYILDEIISKAKKQENAVALYLKILPGFPCHDSITIEPENNAEIIDDVLSIDKKIYIFIDYIGMAKIVMSKKEREKKVTEIFNKMAEKGEEKECFN